jgi:outer membrane protein assembly factor BamD
MSERILLAAALALSGCAGNGAAVLPEAPAAATGAEPEAAGTPSYAEAAKRTFAGAEAELASGSYSTALAAFDLVRARFPYSQYATLAELRIADVHFQQEKWTEAREAYRDFAKLHPTHARASYAYFRVALCHNRAIPSDLVIFPPSYEKDQVEVRRAIQSFDEFLAAYPDAAESEEARKLIAEGRKRLARHERYVADFYWGRKRWTAVTLRLERLLRDYPGLGFDADALFDLGRAYLELGDRDRARAALEKLQKDHAESPRAQDAKALLAGL